MGFPRLLVVAAALCLATGAGQQPAARATFVLTDGARISGEIAVHPEASATIQATADEFMLDVDGGLERIPFDRVVLIDFAGERPRDEELTAVPIDEHLLSMRDGELRRGRLIGLVGGDTVRWELPQGGRIDVPITNVRRVFLQGDRAREMHDVRGRAPGDPAAADAPGGARADGGVPRFARARRNAGSARMTTVATLIVRGSLPWTDTRFNVRRGDVLVLDATGRVFLLGKKEASATPDGNPAHYDARFPMPMASAGALIARVGESGEPFVVVTAPSEIAMPATGRLFLGINDHEFGDNSGAFQVRIKR